MKNAEDVLLQYYGNDMKLPCTGYEARVRQRPIYEGQDQRPIYGRLERQLQKPYRRTHERSCLLTLVLKFFLAAPVPNP